MTRRRGGALLALALLWRCGADHGGVRRPRKTTAAPSWCGPKKITLGLTDGFGGNSWRLVTTAAAKDEIAKCPSVTKLTYADGQGNTQKAISDIQGMVAKGVNALVVFPDAGNAILPALRSAYKAGVMTVPYRVNPGGKAGVDYNVWVGTDFAQAARTGATGSSRTCPTAATCCSSAARRATARASTRARGCTRSSTRRASTSSSAQQPFEVTNWDPALTQQVLTAAIAKYPKIDVIVSDFGPSLVGALPEFKKSGRSIPALATSDGNVLACFWKGNAGQEPDVQAVHRRDAERQRPPRDRLGRRARHRRQEAGERPHFPALVFEDSVTGKPNPVECKADLPGDIYLSAQMSAAAQAKLVKK